jgi:hypothetical protein
VSDKTRRYNRSQHSRRRFGVVTTPSWRLARSAKPWWDRRRQ